MHLDKAFSATRVVTSDQRRRMSISPVQPVSESRGDRGIRMVAAVLICSYMNLVSFIPGYVERVSDFHSGECLHIDRVLIPRALNDGAMAGCVDA